MIGIQAAAYYLPPALGTVSEWCRKQQWTEAQEQALLDSGASQYHYACGQSMVSMACQATEQLLEKAGLQAKNIDALVHFHTSQTNVLPPPEGLVARVRQEVGLDKALSFSISQQNCVSTLHALRVLQQLFAVNAQWQYAIVFGVDVIFDEALRAIGVSGIQSDAASALLISRDAGAARIIALETYNDAKLVNGIHEDGRYEENNNYLWSAVSIIRRALKSASLKSQDLTSILPHNANYPAWEKIVRTLKVEEHVFFNRNISRIGHAFGSDIAINMVDANMLNKAGHHLIFSSGIGGCFGSMVLQTKGVS